MTTDDPRKCSYYDASQACQNRRTALHEAVAAANHRAHADTPPTFENIFITAAAFYEWLQEPLRRDAIESDRDVER